MRTRIASFLATPFAVANAVIFHETVTNPMLQERMPFVEPGHPNELALNAIAGGLALAAAANTAVIANRQSPELRSPRQRLWDAVEMCGAFATAALIEKVPESVEPVHNFLVNHGQMEHGSTVANIIGWGAFTYGLVRSIHALRRSR